MNEPDREVVESLGSYAVAEDGTDFIVYATARPDEILGRFAGDDDGFTRAEELFRSLTAPFRRRRLVRILLVAFVVALVVNVAGVTLTYLLQATESTEISFGNSRSTLIELIERWSSTSAAIANTLWIAILAAMAGLWLSQRVFQKELAS